MYCINIFQKKTSELKTKHGNSKKMRVSKFLVS
jgi:hypothetical protein